MVRLTVVAAALLLVTTGANGQCNNSEIIFLLDGSRSMNKNYRKQIDAVEDFAKELYRQGSPKIGVIQFSSAGFLRGEDAISSRNWYTDFGAFKDDLDFHRNNQIAESTRVRMGLSIAIEMFGQSNTSEQDDRVLFIVTDGKIYDLTSLGSNLALLTARQISVYGIFFGTDHTDALDHVVSKPIADHKRTIDQIEELRDNIIGLICQPRCSVRLSGLSPTCSGGADVLKGSCFTHADNCTALGGTVALNTTTGVNNNINVTSCPAEGTVCCIRPRQNEYTHKEALERFEEARVTIEVASDCSNRFDSRCTSLDGVKREAVEEAVKAVNQSGCGGIRITSGTEAGHCPGTCSNANGWRLGFSVTDSDTDNCWDDYEHNNGNRAIKQTDACASRSWIQGSNSIWCRARDRFDVVFKCEGKPQLQSCSTETADGNVTMNGVCKSVATCTGTYHEGAGTEKERCLVGNHIKCCARAQKCSSDIGAGRCIDKYRCTGNKGAYLDPVDGKTDPNCTTDSADIRCCVPQDRATFNILLSFAASLVSDVVAAIRNLGLFGKAIRQNGTQTCLEIRLLQRGLFSKSFDLFETYSCEGKITTTSANTEATSSRGAMVLAEEQKFDVVYTVDGPVLEADLEDAINENNFAGVTFLGSSVQLADPISRPPLSAGDDDDDDDDDGLAPGIIALICVLSILCCCCIVGAAVFFLCLKKPKESNEVKKEKTVEESEASASTSTPVKNEPVGGEEEAV